MARVSRRNSKRLASKSSVCLFASIGAFDMKMVILAGMTMALAVTVTMGTSANGAQSR